MPVDALNKPDADRLAVAAELTQHLSQRIGGTAAEFYRRI